MTKDSKKKEERRRIGIFDRIKLSLMCKWMEDYGVEEIMQDYPEFQVRHSKLLIKYLGEWDSF